VGPSKQAFFRLGNYPLSYRSSGAMKLYYYPASFYFFDGGQGKLILYCLEEKQYMWLDGDEPYITGSGDPTKQVARWKITPLEY
jgi:hypothetical protein